MVLFFFPLLTVSPAVAGGAEASAERIRLQEEMLRLTQKNAWSGVDRIYRQLVDLPVEVPLQDHLYGAQAAMELGDVLAGLSRLQAGLQDEVQSSDPGSLFQQAKSEIAALQSQYGMIHVVIIDDNIVPALFRTPMPFSVRERTAITFAQTRLVEEREFMGLLPIGTYRLDAEEFLVVSGTPMKEIRLR